MKKRKPSCLSGFAANVVRDPSSGRNENGKDYQPLSPVY
jgi:hypothetical protein